VQHLDRQFLSSYRQTRSKTGHQRRNRNCKGRRASAQAPGRHSRPPPRARCLAAAVPTCPVTAACSTSPPYHRLGSPVNLTNPAVAHSIYLSSLSLPKLPNLHTTSTIHSSSPRVLNSPHTQLPAIPSRSLSLSLRLPAARPPHPVTRFVRDSPHPPTALQYITSIIIAVSPSLILRCLTLPLPHPPLSSSSCQPIPRTNPSSASGSTIATTERHRRLLRSNHPASKHRSCAHRLEGTLKYRNRPRSTLESRHRGGLGASKETD
jgi:hypothetical protein